jgi:phage N-6-adenine-methyltransferase
MKTTVGSTKRGQQSGSSRTNPKLKDLHHHDPTKVIATNQVPPGADLEKPSPCSSPVESTPEPNAQGDKWPVASAPSLPVPQADCPIIGPDSVLGHWIAEGEKQWAKIRSDEKYLTASHWDFAGTLETIKALCGDNIKAWTAAYKKIKIDRRRVSEILLYRKAFETREDAANCSVPKAKKLIRRAGKQVDKPEAYDPYQDCFGTPQWLYDVLDAEFHFGLDAAATAESAKCGVFLTPEGDALQQDWKVASSGKPAFLNPPFHRDQLPQFVQKAYAESQKGLEVVCILPFFKSYSWFRDYVWAFCEMRQIQGPVVFDGFGPKAKKHAGNIAGPQSFDTIVAIFRPGQKGFSGQYIDRPGEEPKKAEIIAIASPEIGEKRKRTNFKQPYDHAAKRDDYFTPAYAVDLLLPYLTRDARIWEAAWGTGELARHLLKAGLQVVGSPEMDLFIEQPSAWEILVTNPPFSKKTAVLRRAYELQKPFALLLPVEALAGKHRIDLYREHGVQLLIPDKRINFHNAEINGDHSAATFPTAWYCWGLNLPRELNFVKATW